MKKRSISGSAGCKSEIENQPTATDAAEENRNNLTNNNEDVDVNVNVEPNPNTEGQGGDLQQQQKKKLLKPPESLKYGQSIPIVNGYETSEERAKFTVFKIKIENGDESGGGWLICRRYTDFDRLHGKLKEKFPQVELPSLPPKRWLGDNFESTFLEKRMKGLQILVDFIFSNNHMVEHSMVRDFFCLDEPPGLNSPFDHEDSRSMVSLAGTGNSSDDVIYRLKQQLKIRDKEIEKLKSDISELKAQKELLLNISSDKNCSHCLNTISNDSPLILSSSSSSTSYASPMHKPRAASTPNVKSNKLVNNKNNNLQKKQQQQITSQNQLGRQDEITTISSSTLSPSNSSNSNNTTTGSTSTSTEVNQDQKSLEYIDETPPSSGNSDKFNQGMVLSNTPGNNLSEYEKMQKETDSFLSAKNPSDI